MKRTYFTAFAFVALVVQAQANTISYLTQGTLTANPERGASLPDGSHLSNMLFSGDLTFPRFDPTLGSLNFIYYEITDGAALSWELLSPGLAVASPFRFNITNQTSALGVIADFYAGPILGHGDSLCGSAMYPVQCGPMIADFVKHFYTISGTISNDTVSARLGNWGQHIAGLPTADLDPYIGEGNLALPVSFFIAASPSDDPLGLALGDILDQQALRYIGVWKYNYTPTEPSAVTPEPGTLGLCGLALIALGLAKRLIHVRAAEPRSR